MSSISRCIARIGSVLAVALLAIGVSCVARAQDAPIAGAAQVLSVAVSNGASSAIVDVRVQGNAQFQWHRLRDPDNRFWIDIANAQLMGPPRDDTEPDPLGELRLRQINPSTVRLAFALTGSKNIDVLPTANGVRIIVHTQDVGDNIVRTGNGTIVAAAVPNATPPPAADVSQLEKTSRTAHVTADASGPTAAQIAAMENGQTVPVESPSPGPIPSPSASPDASNPDQSTGNLTTGDTVPVNQSSDADPSNSSSPPPNPCTSGAVLPADICPKALIAAAGSVAAAAWKFAPHPPKVSTAANPHLIVIDPGHGGSDRGAIRGDLQEATLNLDMAKRLRDILVGRGWQVQMTRTTDVDVYQPNDTAHEELQARVDVGNHAGARLFVSIHSNSFINATPHGTTTYYSKAIDVPLALAVQRDLAENLGTTDDGIIKSKLYVTLHSTMPAILVETAFLSNPDDNAKLSSSAWRQKLAQAIADGIADYAGNAH